MNNETSIVKYPLKYSMFNSRLLRRLLQLTLLVLLAPGSALAVPSGDTINYETSAGKVSFSGKTHAEADNTCLDCHLKPFQMKKGALRMRVPHTNGVSCGTCHDGSGTFSVEDLQGCNKCHKTEPQKGN